MINATMGYYSFIILRFFYHCHKAINSMTWGGLPGWPDHVVYEMMHWPVLGLSALAVVFAVLALLMVVQILGWASCCCPLVDGCWWVMLGWLQACHGHHDKPQLCCKNKWTNSFVSEAFLCYRSKEEEIGQLDWTVPKKKVIFRPEGSHTEQHWLEQTLWC